jgi:hypothetical protein
MAAKVSAPRVIGVKSFLADCPILTANAIKVPSGLWPMQPKTKNSSAKVLDLPPKVRRVCVS